MVVINTTYRLFVCLYIGSFLNAVSWGKSWDVRENKRDLFIIVTRGLVSGDNDEEELIWVEQSAIFCLRRLVESFTTCLSLPCMYTFVYLLRCLACFNAWWFWFRYFLLVENVGHEKRE